MCLNDTHTWSLKHSLTSFQLRNSGRSTQDHFKSEKKLGDVSSNLEVWNQDTAHVFLRMLFKGQEEKNFPCS